MLEGSKGWNMGIQNIQWMPDGMSIAMRLGIDKVKDVGGQRHDEDTGGGVEERVLLIWAEVLVSNRKEEDFMIRRKGSQSIPRDFFLVGQRDMGGGARRLDHFRFVMV